MWTPKRAIKNWLGITKLEDVISTLIAERDIEALLDLAEAVNAEPTIKKGYDASV